MWFINFKFSIHHLKLKYWFLYAEQRLSAHYGIFFFFFFFFLYNLNSNTISYAGLCFCHSRNFLPVIIFKYLIKFSFKYFYELFVLNINHFNCFIFFKKTTLLPQFSFSLFSFLSEIIFYFLLFFFNFFIFILLIFFLKKNHTAYSQVFLFIIFLIFLIIYCVV